MNLPKGQILQNGKYKLTQVIGQGGFGITYKGVWYTEVKGSLGKVKTSVPVCIKEFFFKDYCSRDADSLAVQVHSETGKALFNKFKEKLIKEAKILSEVHHRYIVNVLEVFEENNTAYIAMEFIDGLSLKSILEKKSILPEPIVLKYVQQIGEALQFVHEKSILHLDIKPSNILIDKEGNARLIDFGVSKRYDIDQEETSTTMLTLSKGFASIEQYDDEGTVVFSPHPDIYSLGATMYNLLTGKIPTESILRATHTLKNPSELNPSITKQTEAVILKAMQIVPKDRFDSIASLMKALDFSQVETLKAQKSSVVEKKLSEKKETATDEDESTILYAKSAQEKDNDDDETIVRVTNQPKIKVQETFSLKKKRKKKTYSVLFIIFVIISSMFGLLFFNNKPKTTIIADESPKKTIKNKPESVETEKPIKEEKKDTLTAQKTSELPQEEKRAKINQQQPVKDEVQHPIVKVEVIKDKVVSVQPSETEIDKKYQVLIASAKTKMSNNNFTDAKKDLNDAKETKLTEEVVRLLIECDEKSEKKRLSDKISQYEKKMPFGNFTVVRKKSNNRYGAIDSNGKERIPCQYLSVGIAENGRAFEREDNLFDIYDSKGTLIDQGSTYY